MPSPTVATGKPLPVVGTNVWDCNRIESVFDAKARDFVPKRSLQHTGKTGWDFSAGTRYMDDSKMSFGCGRSACQGDAVTILENTQPLAPFFNRYEVHVRHLMSGAGCKHQLADWRYSWNWPTQGGSGLPRTFGSRHNTTQYHITFKQTGSDRTTR